MPFEITMYPARGRKNILQERALYTFIAVISSVAVTTLISLALFGAVRADFLITAAVCSFTVAVPMTALFQRLNRDLHDALERERVMIVREEKQKTLRQTMHKVQHHVNNLANCLQLVELEYTNHGRLSGPTLASLQAEIRETKQEIQMLGRLEDPFDAGAFALNPESRAGSP